MADDMAARLMARMRGESRDEPQYKGPELDATTAEIAAQARRINGASVAPTATPEEYEARVRARAAQLRTQRVPDAAYVARRQIQAEDRKAAELAERKRNHEDRHRLSVTAQKRLIADAEEKANLFPERKPGDPYVTPGARTLPKTHDRVAYKLLAQFHGRSD